MYLGKYETEPALPPNYRGTAFDKTETVENVKKTEPPKDKPCENTVFSLLPKKLETDDIILLGLIVMLLSSHADDGLLLVLALLLIS